MTTHQHFLNLPKKLPESFGIANTEVQKRASFNTYFFYFCEKLKNVCKEERDRRMNFNQKYGVYIPQSLIPELSDLMPDFQVIGQDNSKDVSNDFNKHKQMIKHLVCQTFKELNLAQ